MKRLYFLAWGFAAAAAVMFWIIRPQTTRKPGNGLLISRAWLANGASAITPAEHCRAPDQTFLTYPEWFLVFGPAEYAESLQLQTSTSFPLMTHVFQTWESYQVVDDQTRGVFPPNDEYHTMIKVIATSSTIEFGLKAAYEAVIGRLTDTKNGEVATDEDRFNAALAKDYVTFLDTAPWYEYDFVQQLRMLWKDTPWFGSHPIRKWERRYLLTTELVVKAVYGKAIEQATHSAYELPSLSTAVVLNRSPQSWGLEVKVVNTLPDGSPQALLPRYAPFTPLAMTYARQGIEFKEIAGNRSAVLVTAVGASQWKPSSRSFQWLFSQDIPTRPGQSRWAVATPVASLSQTLRELEGASLQVEHVFDF